MDMMKKNQIENISLMTLYNIFISYNIFINKTNLIKLLTK